MEILIIYLNVIFFFNIHRNSIKFILKKILCSNFEFTAILSQLITMIYFCFLIYTLQIIIIYKDKIRI